MHKSIHYHLHCLRLIRRSIPLPSAITIASSYIIPIFDYCNSLLFNLREYKFIKLQRVQNSVVSCVNLLPRRSSDSITPLLKQLHWWYDISAFTRRTASIRRMAKREFPSARPVSGPRLGWTAAPPYTRTHFCCPDK